jgi:hypothetical protein
MSKDITGILDDIKNENIYGAPEEASADPVNEEQVNAPTMDDVTKVKLAHTFMISLLKSYHQKLVKIYPNEKGVIIRKMQMICNKLMQNRLLGHSQMQEVMDDVNADYQKPESKYLASKLVADYSDAVAQDTPEVLDGDDKLKEEMAPAAESIARNCLTALNQHLPSMEQLFLEYL